MAKSGRRQPAAADDVKGRLIDATILVLARDGFAHASARAIATEAATVNGSIFYYFGSMDQLLAATAAALADRGIERIRQGLGGDQAHLEWAARLPEVIRTEAAGDDGRAVMELFVGSRTSPVLAVEVRRAIDHAIEFATAELHRVLGDSALTRLIPVPLIAELAAATFLGIEVITQNGRDLDVDRLTATLATGIQLLTALGPPAVD